MGADPIIFCPLAAFVASGTCGGDSGSGEGYLCSWKRAMLPRLRESRTFVLALPAVYGLRMAGVDTPQRTLLICSAVFCYSLASTLLSSAQQMWVLKKMFWQAFYTSWVPVLNNLRLPTMDRLPWVPRSVTMCTEGIMGLIEKLPVCGTSAEGCFPREAEWLPPLGMVCGQDSPGCHI